MAVKELFPGVYKIGNRIATLNMVSGRRAYTEELMQENGKEYRNWNPYRSKLSAAIINGLKHFEIKSSSSVMYLGAATGTTPSHVSDIIGKKGMMYCIELSERNMRNLLQLCAYRENMLPILSDARKVESYADLVGSCDVMYQDISSRDQANVLLANSIFLKPKGYAYFIIKSQSIDISKKPVDVFKNELELLSDTFTVIEKVELEPYDKMHMFAVLQKKR